MKWLIFFFYNMYSININLNVLTLEHNKQSFCSNIDSKSLNNTYFNIAEILCLLNYFFISCMNNIECKIW